MIFEPDHRRLHHVVAAEPDMAVVGIIDDGDVPAAIRARTPLSPTPTSTRKKTAEVH
jgi:hypothetical protein